MGNATPDSSKFLDPPDSVKLAHSAGEPVSDSTCFFLQLPQETKENIYSLLLEDMVSSATVPFADLYQNKIFYNVTQVCKEVNRDVTTLFRKKFAHRVRLCFRNIPVLYDFRHFGLQRWPFLSKATFIIRAGEGRSTGLWGPKDDTRFNVDMDILEVMAGQPGFEHVIVNHTVIERRNEPVDGYTVSDYRVSWSNTKDNFYYICINRPILRNGLRLTSYYWSKEEYQSRVHEGEPLAVKKLGDIQESSFSSSEPGDVSKVIDINCRSENHDLNSNSLCKIGNACSILEGKLQDVVLPRKHCTMLARRHLFLDCPKCGQAFEMVRTGDHSFNFYTQPTESCCTFESSWEEFDPSGHSFTPADDPTDMWQPFRPPGDNFERRRILWPRWVHLERRLDDLPSMT